MTDPGIIDYLITEGYVFEDDDWYGRDARGTITTALKAERSKHGTSPAFKGFEKAYERLYEPGGWSAELKRIYDKYSDEMKKDKDEMDSLKDFEIFKSKDFVKRAEEDYAPDDLKIGGIVDKRYDSTSKKLDLKEKAIEQIEDNLEQQKRDFIRDVESASDEILSARDEGEVDDAFSKIIDDRDRLRAEETLKYRTGKKRGEIRRDNIKRESARLLEPEEIVPLGINNVRTFADQYGWNPNNSEDIAEVKDLLKEKGAKVEGNKFEFEDSDISDSDFITPI